MGAKSPPLDKHITVLLFMLIALKHFRALKIEANIFYDLNRGAFKVQLITIFVKKLLVRCFTGF